MGFQFQGPSLCPIQSHFSKAPEQSNTKSDNNNNEKKQTQTYCKAPYSRDLIGNEDDDNTEEQDDKNIHIKFTLDSICSIETQTKLLQNYSSNSKFVT